MNPTVRNTGPTVAERTLKVRRRRNTISIGDRFGVTFERTLRIPDDGRQYPLPPGLGELPVLSATRLRTVPREWRAQRRFLVPMRQGEALWLGFEGATWKPNAVQIFVGGINAVSGGAAAEGLAALPQNYVVTPFQPWLDGINAGVGVIRQFVATPLGHGHTVEGQLTGHEVTGGIQVRVFEPKPGRFPDAPPPEPDAAPMMLRSGAPAQGMGLGAGGKIQQRIYADPHGVDTWDTGNWGEVFVTIVNSDEYRALTGQEPPESPIDAATYTRYGFPWFDLYDESRPQIGPAEPLEGIRSVVSFEGSGPEPSVDIDPGQIRRIGEGPSATEPPKSVEPR